MILSLPQLCLPFLVQMDACGTLHTVRSAFLHIVLKFQTFMLPAESGCSCGSMCSRETVSGITLHSKQQKCSSECSYFPWRSPGVPIQLLKEAMELAGRQRNMWESRTFVVEGACYANSANRADLNSKQTRPEQQTVQLGAEKLREV